ncbi:uncharacterized protein LOC109546270 isoform X2 [Dendroctonus ponderosae]|uniref:uncharacterized protein LOC109546270 isoform X2 n=1 Tax=Dendroctonus ponderosae TaxID=77166 RepID=UPI0020364674|nr:uncharacterized protein LOC109546270 isoform X2 [Dendroctonus ponderosae]
MPYYSELGVYTPSSSYTSPLLKGPYATHSSILASNILPPSSKPYTRSNFRGYKPHLTPISESNLNPLRRISSPKVLYHSSPKVRVPRPVKISTSDIDASLSRLNIKHAQPQAKQPPKKESSSVVEHEAKPNAEIRRDRPTIRLQTIHKDTVEKEIGQIKSWRDNFQPEELAVEAKQRKKTPGEILKEKFLIRSKSKEAVPQLEPPKLHRRVSVKKSPSFKDICNVITSDQVVEDLNPGQPLEVRRRQSRQFSHDDIIKEIQRSSSTLSVEEVQILDALLQAENEVGLYQTPPVLEEEAKGAKRRKPKPDSNTDGEDASKSHRRSTKKLLKHSASAESMPESTKLRKESSLKNMIKDISQVEIETIKHPVKPRSIITSSVGAIDETPTPQQLKAIVEDLEVEESPKQEKKEKKFRFNVTVQEFPVKKKINAPKYELKKDNYGVTQIPKAKLPVVTSILKKRQQGQAGSEAGNGKEMKKKLLKSMSEVQVRSKPDLVKKSGSNENLHSNFTVMVNKSFGDNSPKIPGSPQGSGKLKIISIANGVEKTHNKEQVQVSIPTTEAQADQEPIADKDFLFKSAKKRLRSDTFLCKSDLGRKDLPSWAQAVPKELDDTSKETISLETEEKACVAAPEVVEDLSEKVDKTQQVEEVTETKEEVTVPESTEPPAVENNNFWDSLGEETYKPPKLSKLKIEPKDPRALLNELQEALKEPETPEELERRMVSKRSLIQKANKSDPDLSIFEPPTPPPPEPVKEPSPEPSFVPLQSNRLSQWMNPWKKPDQMEECPVEIFAKPKFIRARHIPRRWRHDNGEDSDSEDSTTSEEDSSSDEESEEEEEDAGELTKVGASTSSDDSGFDSGRAKTKGSIDNRDSPGNALNPASNPAFALDFNDLPEEVSQSSTYQGFQKSGRITPPATTIPRFRKYCVDDFNFLKVLGKGSFGKVLLAELKGTEYYYAIKCLKKDVVLEDDDVECTLIERKVLALGTKHPYLCHLLCTFQTESHLFFVMEYLNGGDLMFHIQNERRFSEARARFYGAEIVSGLKFLHNKGIVYRDLKLDNILLDFDGHVRIADFGMCKLQIFLDRMADTFCGTPDYMAPEIIKGQHYNQCVDWWSFGVLLYEMLLGQSPFSGGDEDELFWSICNEKPVIPRFLSAEAGSVLIQFLEKDANKRLGHRFSPHGDIQDHSFFQPIDWHALEARRLEPPFKPNLQHPLDTQYFDKTFTIEKAKLTPIETGILQSMDQTQFQGFSYTNPNATDK